ncbi:Fibronectin type III domain protein [Leptothrix cholodnii SP-6]|uniref:Fibronectin type III domain protein n=1 Tax=Leptothrix cholodnii (strain ATCC 51168 / LMG 8142 / SP-6) TaxID=395495 RepID=B1Y3E0_LEPCP|nr:fibronectin type III domain-containing protein [Leptothrix cholodnii]ACB34468.1 Fibronectin type III domain protein [Leptothrix cholodnii SP-6]
MKRTLLALLAVTALDMFAAQAAMAQAASCALANGGNGASPISTGPTNTLNGFSTFVASGGTALELCTDPAFCFFDPVVEGNLFSEQIGTGGESFWYSADAFIVGNNGLTVNYITAAEAAFATEEPVPGGQFSFTRLRIRIDVPQPGIYTLVHPYGEKQWTVDVVDVGNEINETLDISFTPNLAQSSSFNAVGPFLQWDATAPAAPAGFIGDFNVGHTVTGSPCNTNFIRLSGTNLDGTPIAGGIDGSGADALESTEFFVQGKIFTGLFRAPLAVQRATFNRSDAADAQLEVFATVPGGIATTAVSVAETGTPVRLLAPAALAGNVVDGFFASAALSTANPAAMPNSVAVTAADTAAVAGALPTTLLVKAVDNVVITQADYDVAAKVLTVNATSSDTRAGGPLLTVYETQSPVGIAQTTNAPPFQVTVVSASGGTATATVNVVATPLPLAPTALSGTASAFNSVSLSWTDGSTNEAGFRIKRNGVVVGTVGPNVTTFVNNTGVIENTAYNYEVVAYNAAGESEAAAVSVSTPVAPLNAPAVTSLIALSNSSVRINWADNSNNEAGFRVVRTRTDVASAPVTTQLAAGVITLTQTGLVAGATYSYQVVAFRTPANSTTEQTSASAESTIAVPLGATLNAPSGLATTRLSGTSVRLLWADQSSLETGYRVQRSTATVNATTGVTTAGATFATTTSPNGNIAANATLYNNTGLAQNTMYTYRVNAVDGTTQGPTAQIFYYSGTLPTVSGTGTNATTVVGRVVPRWTRSTNVAVAGYTLQRCTLNNTTVCTAAGPWTDINIAGRNTNLYNDDGLVTGRRYSYRIRTVNAAINQAGNYSAIFSALAR